MSVPAGWPYLISGNINNNQNNNNNNDNNVNLNVISTSDTQISTNTNVANTVSISCGWRRSSERTPWRGGGGRLEARRSSRSGLAYNKTIGNTYVYYVLLALW